MSDEKKRGLADTSNKLLTALRHLRDTEQRKRQLPISSPAFDSLAEEVERTSREIFRLARDQDRLGDESEERLTDESARGAESIDDVNKASGEQTSGPS